AGTDEATFRFRQQGPTTLKQIFSLSIKIWTGSRSASADSYIVSALHATATLAPIYEEVKIIVVLINARRFNRFFPRYRRDRRICFQSLSASRIQLDNFNSGPIGTKRQPKPPLAVQCDTWIDRVEIVARTGLNHYPAIGPAITRIDRVQASARGQSNC